MHAPQPVANRKSWFKRRMGNEPQVEKKTKTKKTSPLWQCPLEMPQTLCGLKHIRDYLQTCEQGQRLAEEHRAS